MTCTSFLSVSVPRIGRAQRAVLIALIVLASSTLALAAERCRMCGMDATVSQTEFIIHREGGASEKTCCMHCVYLLQKLDSRPITSLETRDFSSGALVDARKAVYLEGATMRPKGSMAPFLLAFATRDTAERYRQRYQGTIVDFAQAMQIVTRFDEEDR